jgi:hypothetical protein
MLIFGQCHMPLLLLCCRCSFLLVHAVQFHEPFRYTYLELRIIGGLGICTDCCTFKLDAIIRSALCRNAAM